MDDDPCGPKSDTALPAWPAQGTNPAGQERIPTPKRGPLVGPSSTLVAQVAKKKSLTLAYVLVSVRPADLQLLFESSIRCESAGIVKREREFLV